MGSTWQCDHALRNGSRKDVQCPNPALQDWVSGIEGAVMCGLLGACTDALQDFQGLRHLEMSEINMVIDQFVPRLRSTLSRAAPTGKAVASDFFHFGKLASAQNELTTGPMYSSESDSSQPDLELARMCSAAVQGITQTDDAVGRTASEDILRLASAYSGSYASAVQGITQTDDAVGRTASEEILRLASASSGSYAFSSVHNADEVKLLSIQNFLTFTQKLTPSTEQEEQEEDEFVDFATHNFQSIRKSMVAMKSQSKLASFQSLKQSLTFADDIQLTTHEQERYIDSPAAAHHLQSLKNLANVSMVSVGQHLALESMHGASGDLTANARKSTALRPLPEAQSFDNVTCLFFDIVEFSKVCTRRSPADVGEWLLGIHGVVEEHMQQQHVQIVEIRGDCYICLTGTDHVPGDVCGSQVSRMLAFACAVQRDLLEHHNTPLRIGIAAGACTVGYIRANNSSVNVCAYGDTVNMAARMEQHGQQGRVLMTSAAAKLLSHEQGGSGEALPIRTITLKGNRLCATVWYDCATRALIHSPDTQPEPPPPGPFPRTRRNSFPPSRCSPLMLPAHDTNPLLCPSLRSPSPVLAPAPVPLSKRSGAARGWVERAWAVVRGWFGQRRGLCCLAVLLLRLLLHFHRRRRRLQSGGMWRA